MSYNFRPYAQDQMYLMPPSITEWVSEASLARFTSEVLDEMDREGKLAAVYHQYREDGWGSAAYHPVMMVKILVYGYCMGITSSRRMAPPRFTEPAGSTLVPVVVAVPAAFYPAFARVSVSSRFRSS